MNKIFRIIFYSFSIFIGSFFLILLTWRFFREYLVQNVPSESLTEYRFWILLYICFLYFYTIKISLFPKQPNEIITYFMEKFMYIYLSAMSVFDNLFKNNKYSKPYYYKLSTFLINKVHPKYLTITVFVFNILPRSILVFLLLLDMFYFCKLQIFFNFILLGIFPLLYRYYKYSFHNLKQHYLEELENKYEQVLIFEEGFEFDIKKKTEYAKYHHQFVSIRKYFEIKYENFIQWLLDKTNQQFQYIGYPYFKDEIYENYLSQKYNNINAELTNEDRKLLRKTFEETLPLLLTMQIYIDNMLLTENEKIIKWPKIMILTIYLICWSYFLIVSTWVTKGLELTLLHLLTEHSYELLNLFEGLL